MPDTLFDVEPVVAERTDLPPIVGTEKQWPWASHVRSEKLRDCEGVIREWRNLLELWEAKRGEQVRAEDARRNLRRCMDAMERLEKTTSARFWLDNRDLSARELLGLVMGEETRCSI